MGSQSRSPNYPKDAQVIMSILKDMGVADYEQRVLNQLLEFTYRYVTCILDDSRAYATHAKKKTIDLEDVKLAVNMQLDRSFTTPPPREILLEVARLKNSQPLPVIKPSCGIRLPPDRYCLSACNYKLKSNKKPTVVISGGPLGRLSGSSSLVGGPLGGSIGNPLTVQTGLKLQQTGKNPSGSVSVVKRGMLTTVPRTQTITIPKPVIKFSSGGESSRSGDPSQQGTIIAQATKPIKPRIQFGGSGGMTQVSDDGPPAGGVTNSGGGVKRPREEEDVSNEIKVIFN